MSSPIQRLIRKLESIGRLTDDEREALARLPLQVTDLGGDHDIVHEGSRPTRSCLLLEGVARTYKATRDGKRQILSFYVSGDIPDLQSLHLEVMDCSLGTITPCRVAFIQHDALRALCHRHPRLGDILWRTTLIDGAIFREWMLNIGQRQANARVAHFLCEWLLRQQAVGLAQGLRCEFPITQAELGEAMGLSTVHVNRVVQELRGMGLVSLKGTNLEILDWDGLTRVGDFDPTYLHIKRIME